MRTFEQQLQEAVGCSYPLDIILANLSADEILEEVNIFAKEVAKESLKNASDNVKMKEGDRRPPLGSFDYIGTHYTVVDKKSILNESNIPEL